MNEQAAIFFSEQLLRWYQLNKRILPWRQNHDPYRIWVSEIMLQQTRVDTVIPYYERFMSKFPTLVDLAQAPEEDVLKCWEGLGYYSRARNLQAGAKQVVSQFAGVVPDDRAAVASLKGVGPYTTGAIMSIAFNRPVPAVDGNVMRVLSRYFLLEDDIAKQSTRVNIEHLAEKLIPEGEARDFNQALMELGALVCTPKSPGCLICPVMEHCAGRLAGKEQALPIKTKAQPPRRELRLTALIVGTGKYEGHILVRQRAQDGLLARMWELPHVLAPVEWLPEPTKRSRGKVSRSTVQVERNTEHDAERMLLLTQQLAEQDGLDVDTVQFYGEAQHIFSHIIWELQLYEARWGLARSEQPNVHLRVAEQAATYEALPANYRWINREHMNELAFPTIFVQLLNTYWKINDTKE